MNPENSNTAPAVNTVSHVATQMPAFRVTYQDGESYITSMAKGITLDDAKAYFLGKDLTQHDETTKRVTLVEQVGMTEDEWNEECRYQNSICR